MDVENMLTNSVIESKQNKYFKPIFSLALPIIIQGLVIQIQTIINRAFLGNLKTEYLSAIGNTIFPFNTTLGVLLAISTGVTITIAHKIGAKKTDEVKDYFITALFYNSILTLIISIIWFTFAEAIFSIMGVDKTLVGYCTSYVKILDIYVILYGIDMSIQSTLQGIGITRPIMYAGICKVLLNVFLDWVLIYGNLGFSGMGVLGAATSTTLSNIFSILVLIIYILFFKKFPFSLKFSDFSRIKFNKYKEMAKIGIPTGCETFIWYIGNLTLIRLLNSLNYIAVGIYTLTYGIEIVIYVIYNGLARAALTLIGHKIGEKNGNEAKKVLSTCIKYDLVIICLISTLFIIFSKQILGIFTSDINIVNKASIFFVFTSLTLFPKSLNVIVGSGIRGIGDTRWMLYTQILGTVMVISISSITIFVLRFNIIGIYITIFLDESIRAALNIYHFFKKKRDEKIVKEECSIIQ
jgi:putative MATE family efflux protein